jgi:DNA ligase-1
MKSFVELFDAIDQTNKSREKIKALVHFLEVSNDEDSLWAIALIYGKKPKRTISSRQLKEWATELSPFPEWLFEETLSSVGDLAETIAYILPESLEQSELSLSEWMTEIMALSNRGEEEKHSYVLRSWSTLNISYKLVFNKLITGSFRIGISKKNLIKAIAQKTQRKESDITYKLSGEWNAWTHSLDQLLNDEGMASDLSKPYPLFFAQSIKSEATSLGDINNWQIEYKWDGLRAQLIKRNGELFLWSKDEDLITKAFPEFEVLKETIDDGIVLDGQVLAFRDRILPLQHLQKRINRKNLSKKLLQEAPVVFRAFDIMEYKGKDVRHEALSKRRIMLEKAIGKSPIEPLQISPIIKASSWNDANILRLNSRDLQAVGLLMKDISSPYEEGISSEKWWEWKTDSFHIDAVMLYASKGYGQHSNVYNELTFAVWDKEKLLPFTKASAGLTITELKELDQFVKQHTKERFGPVRSVDAELVFEIAFEAIQASSRHKSGIVLRSPRIARWRKDKKADAAGTIEELHALLDAFGS